jgi:WD40 repeat protein
VADLQRDIEAYQNGRATSAENAGLGKQLVLLVRRHKALFGTAALAWLVITSLAVWFVLKITASERETRRQAGIARQNEALAVQQKEEARKALARSAVALAEAARRDGNSAQMQAALSEVPEDLRGSTWHYLLDQSDTSIARVHVPAKTIDGVAADPQRPGVFAAVANSGQVFLLDGRTGEQLLEFTGGRQLPKGNYRVAFSADGTRIAIGHAGVSKITIHSARDGSAQLEWKTPYTRYMEFSLDGRMLLQISNDETTLSIWDAATGALRWNYVQQKHGMKALFTPDSGHVLVSGSQDYMRLVNAQDGAMERQIVSEWATAIALRPDGRELIYGHGNSQVKALSLSDDKTLFDVHTGERSVDHLAFTPDGTRIVSQAWTTDGRQNLQVWDGTSGIHLQTLLGGSGSVTDMAVHPSTGELLVVGPESRVWDLTGVPEKWNLKYGAWDAGVAFWGADDLLLAAIGGTTGLYKLQPGSPVGLWTAPQKGQRRPSVSADGGVVAISAPGNTDLPYVILRKTGTNVEQIASFKPVGGAGLIRLSPSGERLFAIQPFRHAVDLYDTATGTQPVTLEWKDMATCNDADWVDGGRGIVGLVTMNSVRGNRGSEEWLVRWDAATGKVVQRVMNPTPMDVLAVTSDGKRLAEGGTDRRIRIRDAGTLLVEKEFRAHDGPITALAWHPSKAVLASSSSDLSVRLWDVEAGRRLEELRGPLAFLNSLAFSPSGRRLACTGNDSITRVWEPHSLNERPGTEADAGGWEDVLASLTPGSIAQFGHGWRLEGGALFSPGQGFATLPLGVPLGGKSYQLRLKLRELSARESFDVLLPIGNNVATFVLDGWPSLGRFTSLNMIDRKEGKDLPDAVKGKVIPDANEHDLEITVRLDGPNATVTASFDGSPLYHWIGPHSAPQASDRWPVVPGNLEIGSMSGDWVVYEIKLKRL